MCEVSRENRWLKLQIRLRRTHEEYIDFKNHSFRIDVAARRLLYWIVKVLFNSLMAKMNEYDSSETFVRLFTG